MNEDILSEFLVNVAGNPKISASHISLFSVILCLKQNQNEPFNIIRRDIMNLSKIRSTATYHKCLGDLVYFGFIDYKPSFHPKGKNKWWLLNL
jgi:hypothetical protein